MAFLPADFEVPALLETDRFRLRPISVDDLAAEPPQLVAGKRQ